jgi:hypothetical protein
MAATHTRQPANRMMYKGLLKAGADASERIVKEQLQVAYMELYGYVPELQTVFDNTITSIKEAEASSHKELSKALQEQLPNLELQRLSDTVSIGNLLRKTVDLARLELRTKIRKIAAPLRAKMLALIQQPDDVLADIERRAKFTKELATRKDEPGVLP